MLLLMLLEAAGFCTTTKFSVLAENLLVTMFFTRILLSPFVGNVNEDILLFLISARLLPSALSINSGL